MGTAAVRMRSREEDTIHLQEPVLLIMRESCMRCVDGESHQLGAAGNAVPAHRVHDSVRTAGFLLVHRKEGLDVLFRAAKDAILTVWGDLKKGVPGIIAVVHTFGGDLKWNPHVHVIVTCGGLNGEQWKWMNFVPYEKLKAAWQYGVVDGIRQQAKEHCTGKAYTRFNRGLDFLYRKKWYVNVGKKLDSLEITVRYIGRYTKRPVMAETRLKEFDGETVTFTHKDKQVQAEAEIRLPVEEFIGKLVRHIPEKNHRMIRYAGIFASRVKREKLALVRAALGEGCLPMYAPKPMPSWRERIRTWTGVDPYQCSCGRMMALVCLVVRVKGGKVMTIRGPPSGSAVLKTPNHTFSITRSSME